jgi:hypothetical protein
MQATLRYATELARYDAFEELISAADSAPLLESLNGKSLTFWGSGTATPDAHRTRGVDGDGGRELAAHRGAGEARERDDRDEDHRRQHPEGDIHRVDPEFAS